MLLPKKQEESHVNALTIRVFTNNFLEF